MNDGLSDVQVTAAWDVTDWSDLIHVCEWIQDGRLSNLTE